MKKYLTTLVLMFAMFLVGCCFPSKTAIDTLDGPDALHGFINDLKLKTVALVSRDADGDIAPYCTGVWVDTDKILTADHCARGALEMLLDSLQLGNLSYDSFTDDEVDSMVGSLTLSFIVESETTGVYREPKAMHPAHVIRHDRQHDLALLQVNEPATIPFHAVAQVGEEPQQGDSFHVVGHVMAMYWTYTHGNVAALREADLKVSAVRGPWVQASVGAFKGNSGGGGFNDAGQLVGIASFLMPAPNECFFVSASSIKAFLLP